MKLYVVCTHMNRLIEAILMSTQIYNYCVENRENFPKLSLFASWPGTMINPHWLELPMSRTIFYGRKDVRAIEVRLYYNFKDWELLQCIRRDLSRNIRKLTFATCAPSGQIRILIGCILKCQWTCLFIITRTCIYNFDPLKPHFYIVLIFLFLLKNIDCGYSLEPPRRVGSNEYPQSMFWAEI